MTTTRDPVKGGVSDSIGQRGVIETLSELKQKPATVNYPEPTSRVAMVIANSLSDPATDCERTGRVQERLGEADPSDK